MRVLFLTQYYPPETCAAPLRAYHFAVNLVRRGHRVTVVTGMPNHPGGVKHAGYARRLAAREESEGVRILRCYLCASPKKSFVSRMANQISFMVTSFLGALTAGPCDIILVSSPPLFLGATAWLLHIIKGAPFVLDLRDYWPRAAVELGQLRNRAVRRLAERLEVFLYRRAARLVVVTPAMLDMLLRRGVSRHRIELIMNGADLERFVPAAGFDEKKNGKSTVIYGGTHGLVHGMEVILDAAEILKDDGRIEFLLVGDGVAKPRLMSDAGARGLSNIRFVRSQQPEELAQTIRSADVCVATTGTSEFSATTVIPVKMFDYMACGRPIVAAVGGDARHVIEEAHGGIVVEPGDGAGLASAVLRLVGDPELRRELGDNGHEYVTRMFSRGDLALRMEGVLKEIHGAEKEMGGGSLSFRSYLACKYTLDFVGAVLFLILTSPVFLLVTILIKLDSPGAAVFTQRRIGVYSQEFTIYKFRTMRSDTPDLATDLMTPLLDTHTTRIGRFLRRTSLDELPNVLNILRGDMSLVGPRPALYNQHELVDLRRQAGADLVRPGITGWAQINGRDTITLEEKIRLDEFYVRNCSLLLDLRILLRTFTVMLNSEEIPRPKGGGVRSKEGGGGIEAS